MGASNSKSESETINWNNIKTENVSTLLPNFNGLSNDAKQLIASLNIPSITESQTSELVIDNILNKINTGLNQTDKNRFNQLLEKVSSQTESEGLSNTSPFISSEMYDYLINNKTSEDDLNIVQAGGSKKNNNRYIKKGGNMKIDDSDTSSTSSDSSLEDILDSTEEEIKAKKEKKDKEHNKSKKQHKSESSSEMSGGDLSYLSSSAHTSNEFSDSKSSQRSSQSESLQTTSDTHSSVTNENSNIMGATESVNTSDINMISDY